MIEKRDKITSEISISKELMSEIETEIKNVFTFQEKIKNSFSKDTSELVNVIMAGSIALNSSDIHIEPEEGGVKIRIRIDGILQDIIKITNDKYQGMISRIKLLSGTKLNITNRPQDGRFSIIYPTKEKHYSIEIRMSILPSEYGETIVMRILDSRNLITIDKLGLEDKILEIFKKEIKKPNGMVIVTGPTGSGKTTSLYAFLKHIKSPEKKIITIENPIEYHLEGISQTEVAPEKGYDFANGLRAIVRQDPDAILVGEIRDLETASIALQAALTGHIVFSTIHANDAPSTIPRLQALGERPVNIAPAINIIIAQRLARMLCDRCKERTSLEELPKLLEIIKTNLPDFNPNTEKIELFKKKGCKQCNFTGYKGRLGIYEALVVDEEIEDIIFSDSSATAIRKKAVEKGMVTLLQDAILKILKGETDLEEIDRVIGL